VDSEQPDLRLGWIPTFTAACRVEGACMDVEAGRPGDAAVAAVEGCKGRHTKLDGLYFWKTVTNGCMQVSGFVLGPKVVQFIM
jgi:hypothetical protein